MLMIAGIAVAPRDQLALQRAVFYGVRLEPLALIIASSYGITT
jgi:hypothetical protein